MEIEGGEARKPGWALVLRPSLLTGFNRWFGRDPHEDSRTGGESDQGTYGVHCAS